MAFLKLNEVATVLRISRQTVAKLVDNGQLRAVQVGGQRRVDSADFQLYLRNNSFPLGDNAEESDAK